MDSNEYEGAKICSHCGQSLKEITFFVHQHTKDALEWLVEDRKVVAGEQNISQVLSRLITLEATKRQKIAVQKQQSVLRREQEKNMREELKAIRSQRR